MKIIFTALILIFQQSLCFAISNFTHLSAFYESSKKVIKLKWQNNNSRVSTFILQKSTDNIYWKDLYILEKSDFSQFNIESYTDGSPDPIKNHYRLKIFLEDNSIQFSLPISVFIGKNAGSWNMYPVPVGTVLNLQYTGSELITSAIYVIIQNSRGQVLCRLRTATVSRTIQIPVANLGRGIYHVRIMLMDKTIWSQQFIK